MRQTRPLSLKTFLAVSPKTPRFRNNALPSRLTLPLGLAPKLSQTHVSQIIIALVFAASAVGLLAVLVTRDAALTKDRLTTACSQLETTTNALASTPRIVAQSINTHIAHSIDRAKQDAANVLAMTVSLIKNILLFILLRYQKVVQCILFLTVHAGLEVIAKNAAEITAFINQELKAISSAVSGGLSAINSQLQQINDATSHISLIGASVPKIPLPLVIPGLSDHLSGWSLPNGTMQTLANLGNGPSTLQDLHQDISNAISAPFDAMLANLKSEMDSSFSKINASALTLLPLPSPVTSIRFCDKVTLSGTVDRLVEGLLVSLWMVLFFILFASLAVYFWQCVYVAVSDYLLRQDWLDVAETLQTSESASMDGLVKEAYVSLSFPVTLRLARVANLPPAVTWFLVYLSSNPLVGLCFVVGSIGLLVIQLQLVLIPWIFSLLLPFLVQDVQLAADEIYQEFRQALNNSIGTYIGLINSEITHIEDVVNTALSGWLGGLLQQVDHSVTAIFSSFQKDLDAVLGGFPPLESAVDSFFTCVVGNITNDLAQLSVLKNTTLPRITADYFPIDAASLIGPQSTQSFASQLSQLSTSSLSQSSRALFLSHLNDLIQKYRDTLWIQSIPFVILLCFAGSVFLAGLVFILVDSVSHNRQPESG
ncbi:plasma membrane fusion protein prm1 [Kappamyces sp. JEL0829]|nr:plasma membrane fusion protein prm1 [Kappamyces sp. JEL0829]